jgi:hypothetical protein
MEFKNLQQLIQKLSDEQACREYLAKQRWPNGIVICPYCNHNKCYSIEKGARYKCGNKECYKKFSVKVGTIFEASNIPLNKWFIAMYLATANKKGISSYQLAKHIGISQKCSWFMLHRIREIMRPKEPVKLDNIVEVDEVYIGGKVSNMNKHKRKILREANAVADTKVMVMGLVERGGELKLISSGESTGGVPIVHKVIQENVDKDAVLMTDTSANYVGLKNDYAAHETVNHTINEYVRDQVIYTNTIEGAFSHLKRTIIGTYHKVTIKHLNRYCEETAFRYNLRKMKDADRFILALIKAPGRLKYKDLILSPAPKIEITIPTPQIKIEGGNGRKIAVLQIKNGEVIAQYPSIKEAAQINNLDPAKIRLVLLGQRHSTGGFEWKYA